MTKQPNTSEEKNLTPEMERLFNEAQQAMDGYIEPDPDTPPADDEPDEDTDTPPTDTPEPEPADSVDDDPDDDQGDDVEPDADEDDDFDLDDEDDPGSPNDGFQRPQKYIPIPKYKDEKQKWTNREQELLQQIEDLKQSNPNDKNGDFDTKIKSFADENNLDENQVRGIVDLAKSVGGLSDEDRQVLDAYKKSQMEQVADQQDAQYFKAEFKNEALPILRKMYPNATKQQLREARELLDTVSHTEEYHQSPLRHVVKLEGDQLNSIFGGSTPQPKKKARTTEPSRSTSHHSTTTLSATDIKSKKDFPKIQALPQDQQEKILSELHPVMYDDYATWLRYAEQGVTVTRQGRRINLR